MNKEPSQTEELERRTVQVEGDNNNPIIVITARQTDTLGVLILGVLAFILLFALQKSETRNRALMAQLIELAQRQKGWSQS